MAFKAGEGAGRSGSFFFFTHDNKFIIKTLSTGELKLYLNLLDDFGRHYRNNKFSLLSKIFGVYTIETEGTGTVHIMLMENTV